jgi:hypothetical protein
MAEVTNWNVLTPPSGHMKWMLTMKTVWMASPRVSNSRRHPARPPHTLLTSEVSVIQLQRLKVSLKGNFEFHHERDQSCHERNGGFSTIRSHFYSNNLSYFVYYSKFQKLIKAAIRHLSVSPPAEDISDALVDLGFEVTSSKQMPATCRSQNNEHPH